jgi:predicted nuclease of restriction endonuclease-like (RecB) superfamily
MAEPPARPGDPLPSDYPQFLDEVKARVASARAQAVLAVSAAVLAAYWEIGTGILEREHREGWGAKVIERLAADLRREFPEMKGLSPRNLRYMRDFARAWPAESVREMLQQPAARLPWGHHIVLFDKLSEPDARYWYASYAAEHGCSRKVLEAQIASDLRARHGAALTTFERALPPPDSELVRDALKDPYNFEFLSLSADAKERDLEQALRNDVQSFLMDMGRGFALVAASPRRGHRRGVGVLPRPPLLQLHPAALRRDRPEDRGFQARVRRQDELLPHRGGRTGTPGGRRRDDRPGGSARDATGPSRSGRSAASMPPSRSLATRPASSR